MRIFRTSRHLLVVKRLGPNQHANRFDFLDGWRTAGRSTTPTAVLVRACAYDTDFTVKFLNSQVIGAVPVDVT